jgi:hypothetical protein
MACCAISKDWPLTSNRRFGVSASTRVATVMPCSLRGFASRQHTTKEAVPSFFLRFRMLATQKTVRRCQHFGRFCQHPKTQQAPDLQKHCARGGTRTAFQTLNFRYFPENLAIRPSPPPVRPDPKPRVCTLCTPSFYPLRRPQPGYLNGCPGRSRFRSNLMSKPPDLTEDR